jgi:hypothetical protein
LFINLTSQGLRLVFIPSAVITEGAIPKAIEKGATFVFHLLAVVATVGTDTSQDFEEGGFLLS